MHTRPGPVSAGPAPRSVTAADALVGRIVRLRLIPDMDRVVDDLWAAGFALAELAEAAVQLAPVPVALADQIQAAGTGLWVALDAADELYCALAGLCAQTAGTSR